MTSTVTITSFLEADPETGETWKALEVRDESGQLLSTTLE